MWQVAWQNKQPQIGAPIALQHSHIRVGGKKFPGFGDVLCSDLRSTISVAVVSTFPRLSWDGDLTDDK